MRMDKNNLRKSLFGYKKTDVMEYIDTIVTDYEAEIEQIKKENTRITKENKVLLAENNELFRKNEEFMAEKELISDAFISAKERAGKIIEEAEAEAENKMLRAEEKLQVLREEEEALKEQIQTLKLKAVAAIRKYETELSDLA